MPGPRTSDTGAAGRTPDDEMLQVGMESTIDSRRDSSPDLILTPSGGAEFTHHLSNASQSDTDRQQKQAQMRQKLMKRGNYVAPQRFDWDQLQKVATGCREDYFVQHSNSIRVDFPEGGALGRRDFDPVAIMKEGIMVLYYDQTEAMFVRKVLKVDEQLRFLHILDGNPKNAAQAARQAPQILSTPLTHIKRIYTMDEAVHLCEENGIALDSLKLDSTFVLWVDPSAATDTSSPELDEEMPPLDKLFIFMASKEQQLRRCIQSCKDFTEGKSDSKHVVRKRVDQVAIQDVEELLDKDTPDFKFDLSFRGDSSLRTVTVFTDTCEKTDLGGVKEKLEQELLPSDHARVHFVLQDAIAFRRVVTSMNSDMFKRGLCRFVQEWETNPDILRVPLPENLNLPETAVEIDTIHRRLGNNASDNAEIRYHEASTRAAIAALRNLCKIEKEFNNLISSGEVKDNELENDMEAHASPMSKKAVAALMPQVRWRCLNCKFFNDAETIACEVCAYSKEGDPPEVAGAAAVAPAEPSNALAAVAQPPITETYLPATAPAASAVGRDEVPGDVPQRAPTTAEDSGQPDIRGLEAPAAAGRDESSQPPPVAVGIPASNGKEDPPRKAPDKRNPERILACAGAGGGGGKDNGPCSQQ